MLITRREFLRNSTGSLALLAMGKSSIFKKTIQRRPNILWIMTDQQPISTLGCYGNKLNPTPAIDKIAEKGFLFRNFGIAAIPCSPSRASFLTGLYPHQHGVVVNDIILDKSIPTMGTLFAGAGYDTAYFGKCHLGGNMYRSYDENDKNSKSRWCHELVKKSDGFTVKQLQGGVGEDQPQLGFKEWAGGWKQYHEYLKSVGMGDIIGNPPKIGCHNDAPSAGEGEHMYSKLGEEHHMAAFFRKRAVDFLQKRKDSDKPFCVVVSFYGPHLPVAPPKPWDTKYSLDQVTLPPNHEDDLSDTPISQTEFKRQYRHNDWNKNQYLDYIRRYYGYCAYIDFQVGKILKALDEAGQADDTIIVYTTDHGDMVGAHGLIFKLLCGYDELIHVPFILSYPRLKNKGVVIDSLVSSIDVLPTIAELAGVDMRVTISGRSFRGLIESKSDKFSDFIVCEHSGRALIIYDMNYKYVCNWANPKFCDEFYDRKKDPGEIQNLIDDKGYKKQIEKMQKKLADWLKKTKYPYKDLVIKSME